MSFKDNLRQYREAAGISSAKEFSKILDVPYSTYIGYETEGREPKYDLLIKIATTLGVSIDELLGYSLNEFNRCKKLIYPSYIASLHPKKENIVIISELKKDGETEHSISMNTDHFISLVQQSEKDAQDEIPQKFRNLFSNEYLLFISNLQKNLSTVKTKTELIQILTNSSMCPTKENVQLVKSLVDLSLLPKE